MTVTPTVAPLTIKIVSPPDQAVVSTKTVAVTGVVSDSQASVKVNGIPATVTGKIYVVGGTRNFPDPLPERLVQVYDPLKDSWFMGPRLKTRRQGLAVVSTAEGRIYAIGGTSYYGAFHP